MCDVDWDACAVDSHMVWIVDNHICNIRLVLYVLYHPFPLPFPLRGCTVQSRVRPLVARPSWSIEPVCTFDTRLLVAAAIRPPARPLLRCARARVLVLVLVRGWRYSVLVRAHPLARHGPGRGTGQSGQGPGPRSPAWAAGVRGTLLRWRAGLLGSKALQQESVSSKEKTRSLHQQSIYAQTVCRAASSRQSVLCTCNLRDKCGLLCFPQSCTRGLGAEPPDSERRRA